MPRLLEYLNTVYRENNIIDEGEEALVNPEQRAVISGHNPFIGFFFFQVGHVPEKFPL